MSLLITGARVIDSNGERRVDVRIADARVCEVGTSLTADEREEAWLTTVARQGWHLTEPWLLGFSTCPPIWWCFQAPPMSHRPSIRSPVCSGHC